MARKRVTGAGSPLDAAPNLGNALQLDQAILGQLRGLGGAQPGGLVIADDGTVSVGSFRLTGKGIIGGERATAEELTNLGKFLGRIQGSLQWLLGDWAVRAERVWGASYAAVAAEFGLSVNTLYEYARVCRAVEFSIRIENLSFGHHQLVAALEPAQMTEWLRHAAAHGLSIAKLREAISPTTPRQLVAPVDAQKALLVLKNMTPESLTDDYHRQSTLNAITRVREWLDQLEDDLNG